jgi:PadR family transcriptional regulator
MGVWREESRDPGPAAERGLTPAAAPCHCLDMSTVDMSNQRQEMPRGMLDLLILRTLETMGALHGYAIARRIEQVARGDRRLSQGSIYPALVRLQQQGSIRTRWGTSETNRRVKFYELTNAGTTQLHIEIAGWQESSALIARFLEAKP